MVSAYFAAKRISVYADNVCYYWMRRVDGSNASFHPVAKADYYDSVIRVLEVVEANTQPGQLRDRLYAHWYRGKMLAPARGRSLLRLSRADQERLVSELRRVSRRFGLGEAQHRWLGAPARVCSHLLLHGDLDELRALAEAEAGARVTPQLTGIAWSDDGLRLAVTASVTYEDGRPVRVRHEGGRVRWRVDDILPGVDLPDIDLTKEFPRSSIDVLARDRETMSVTFLSRQSVPPPGDELTVSSEVIFDPAEVFADGPIPAVSDLLVRVNACGWAAEERLPVGDFKSALAGLGSRRLDADWVWPYTSRVDQGLSVGRATSPPAARGGPEFLRRTEEPVPGRLDSPQPPMSVRARALLTMLSNKDNWTSERVSRSVRRRAHALIRRLPLRSSHGGH